MTPKISKDGFAERKIDFRLFAFYQYFEHLVIFIVTLLIAVVVVAAVWKLVLKIGFSSIFANGFDPSDYKTFQAIFGMIFTVIIALEFKKSLLIVAERNDSVVQISSVLVIALLAVCRKLIILDLGATDAIEVVSLAAAILALGLVYWLIHERHRGTVPEPPRRDRLEAQTAWRPDPSAADGRRSFSQADRQFTCSTGFRRSCATNS